MQQSDLLTRIRAELDARLRELRPLLSEYERLLAAEAALGDAGESAQVSTRGRGGRAPLPTPAPSGRAAVRRGRPPGRPRADRSAAGAVERAPSSPASRRSDGAPKRARGAAAAAIVAALEHGSHTVSELGVVTALSSQIIHNNLHRLREVGTVTRTKRPGDGKSAYALTSTTP